MLVPLLWGSRMVRRVSPGRWRTSDMLLQILAERAAHHPSRPTSARVRREKTLRPHVCI